MQASERRPFFSGDFHGRMVQWCAVGRRVDDGGET